MNAQWTWRRHFFSLFSLWLFVSQAKLLLSLLLLCHYGRDWRLLLFKLISCKMCVTTCLTHTARLCLLFPLSHATLPPTRFTAHLVGQSETNWGFCSLISSLYPPFPLCFCCITLYSLKGKGLRSKQAKLKFQIWTIYYNVGSASHF